MGKSSDEIRQEIDDQRARTGDKIDQMEQQVQDNARHMRDQAVDTAEQLRDQAQGVVTDTIETVKEDFDLNQQIQERPLVAVGAAMLGGFMLGSMTGGDGQSHHTSYSSTQASGNGSEHHGNGMGHQLRSAIQKSGVEDTLSNAAAALMGSVTEQLKGTMDQNFPGFSEKLDTAESKRGSFSEKAKATQHEAQQA